MSWWRTYGVVRWLGLTSVLATAGLMAWAGYGWYQDRQIQQTAAACELARKSGNWKQLEQLASRLRTLQPGSGNPVLFLAEAAETQGQIQKAADLLGEFPESDVRAPLVLAQKANLEWGKLNRPFDALKTSDNLIRLRPRTISTHARIVSFYAMTLQRPELLAAIRRAIEMDAEPREAYTYLMMADSLTFSNAVSLNSFWKTSAADPTFFEITIAVLTASDRTARTIAEPNPKNEAAEMEARKEVEKLQVRYPSNRILLGFLLDRCLEEGNVQRAAELLGHVTSEDANDHLLWIHRGWYHTHQDEFKAAETCFQTALKLHPMSWLARREYATLLRRQQKIAEAEKLLQLVVTARELRKELLKLSNAREITEELVQRIANYSEACDDRLVYQSLQKRLASTRQK